MSSCWFCHVPVLHIQEISTKISRYIAIASIAILCIAVLEGKSQKKFNVVDYGATGDGQTDDSQAFQKGWQELCAANDGGQPTLTVPSAKTFLVKPLEFRGPCKSQKIHFQILGTIIAPKYTYKDETWLKFSGVNGLIINGNGQINGRGSIWWPPKSTRRVNGDENKRPTALYVENCTNVELSGLTHLDSPRNHISIDGCSWVNVYGVKLRAPGDSPNTDGIDIANSKQLFIHDSFIGTGDDCIAINDGSSYINISKILCGPGHGISVGSLGLHEKTETVEQVRVWNCTFNGTENGARIKTWQGGSGHAKNIKFEELIMINAYNPIIINQYYCENSYDCTNQTSAVEISDVTFKGIKGTSASEIAVNLKCSKSVACKNVNVFDVNLTYANSGKKVTAVCCNAQGTFRSATPNIICSST